MESIMDNSEETWELLWQAREDGLRPIFGNPDDNIFHSAVPFFLGRNADVLRYRNHCGGMAYVTADLTGNKDPNESESSQYELVICHRSDDDWGPNIISQLAKYTLENRLNPFETMDIGSAISQPSQITAFLFVDYGTFELQGSQCGLLLCLGITKPELTLCRTKKSRFVLEKIKEAGVFPFTDLERNTVPGIAE